ncbi:MAG: hypothetical protein MI757_02380, partial [Pirellulales bacterium]|nr:hypothetical protein [Pirellulales bacterium]
MPRMLVRVKHLTEMAYAIFWGVNKPVNKLVNKPVNDPVNACDTTLLPSLAFDQPMPQDVESGLASDRCL